MGRAPREVRSVVVAFDALEESVQRLLDAGWVLVAVIPVGPDAVRISVAGDATP